MTSRLLATMLLAGFTGPVLAAGTITVDYVQPEKFTDVKERQFKTSPDKNAHLKNLKSWLEKEGVQQLADGQTLRLKILDIDLAGDFEPWNGPEFQDVRVLKDIYPPRIKLQFTLQDRDGKVLGEGERELRNLSYLMESSFANRNALEHDERLLKDWLRKEFPKPE
ncbi:MAG TPA: DUF3016 domain-containing protein [Permianibacter sp.]|nr:DUF3016 domain-containing protein [Permianibacter sp.]